MSDKADEFLQELTDLLNRYSIENRSDTPDFILAEYIVECLTTWNRTVTRRSEWYKPDPSERPS